VAGRTTGLEGLPVRLVVSDPWEFGTAHGTGPFPATVLAVGAKHRDPRTDAVLVRLTPPLVHDGVPVEYLIATPRLEGADVKALAAGQPVDAALTRIPAERAQSGDPFDLSWWRGGLGLIGRLEPAGR
jgi:hypothetical protein